MSPGSLVYVGERTDEPVKISIMDYTGERLDEYADATIEDIRKCMREPSVTWVNISGIHDMTIIEMIGKEFDLHPLLLEDLVNTRHRAKIDDYEDYFFIVLKMVFQESGQNQLQYEHVCLVVGPSYLISFQEREGDVFGPVRDRLRKLKGRIRKAGPDYLGYALMDMIVDHYYVILEQMGEEIESIQEEALENPTDTNVQCHSRNTASTDFFTKNHLAHAGVDRQFAAGRVRADSRKCHGLSSGCL